MYEDIKSAIDNIGATFTYVGSFDKLPDEPRSGDICYIPKENMEYVSVCGEWMKLGPPSDNESKEDRQIKPKICVKCGAPLNGLKCEYCGTEYEYVR